MRSVENAECGKCGVWKMRSVENAECRKYIKEKDYIYIHAYKILSHLASQFFIKLLSSVSRILTSR